MRQTGSGSGLGLSLGLRSAVAALFVLLAGSALAHSNGSDLPDFAQVRAAYRVSEAWLLDRHGQPLHRLRVDKQVRRLPWTRLESVSPALIRAVILSEDRHFYEHGGVDWSAAGKAFWEALRRAGRGEGFRTRGASTLSMQLVGLIDEEYQRRGRRSLVQKLGQTLAALRLEQQWSKPRILEAYLNLVSFRGELQGVAAMSRQLFGKWPEGLDEEEAALAAALLRAPNAAPEHVARRACILLKEMGRDARCPTLLAQASWLLSGQRDSDLPEPAPEPDRIGSRPALQLAPHLAARLLHLPGQRLRTTLDADVQRLAGEALRRNLATLARRHVQDGAVLVLDNTRGEVLAWVGSSGELSAAGEVDAVVALRQAGSTLKPFLYAMAFEARMLTPASLIEDAPLSLETGNGLYTPQNYEPDHQGWVSARTALAGSLNVPAVRTLVRVGPDAFQQRLRRAGLESLKREGDWYGYSLALGSADVSLLQMANAYRMLANGGQWSPLRLAGVAGRSDALAFPCRSEGCEDVFKGPVRRVYPAAVAYLTADILADRSARAGTFGLESWLSTPYWSAVKTGTSKDMRDNWCIGFSRHYTVAVWVGNASGAPMHDVSGIAGAAPVWREVMDFLHRGEPSRSRAVLPSPPPPLPAGVIRRFIRFEPALEPSRQEVFLAGTEMDVVRQSAGRALARIAYPAEGTIIALDPDIPPPRQRLLLRLSAQAGTGWRWRMDGRILGPAALRAFWSLRPGRHRLVLEDGRGQPLDEVRFEVRALRGKAG